MFSKMKSYSNTSPRRRSDQDTSMNLNQSLFMDETSADLENYLNTSLPETSNGDQISYIEQDLGCLRTPNLSKSISGKVQRSSRDNRKNKFFKSKSFDEKRVVNPSEIPVINEAMKKIFKETPCKANQKQSPTTLKTYSNKYKDKTQIVESFGLPDEPFLSKEQNSIDLDEEPENGNFSNSLIFEEWVSSDTLEYIEINLNDEFRRKSFSTIDNDSLSKRSLETEVKEGFNFEEDILIPDASKPSNEEKITKENRSPVVLLKSLNLNDISFLKANNLSPWKNRRDMLLERWQIFSSNLKDMNNYQKGKALHRSPQYKKSVISKTNSRSTRSYTSTVELESLLKNAGDSIEFQFDTNDGSKASELKDVTTVEEQNKKILKGPNLKKIQNLDDISPRRITRRSAQQTFDPLPLKTSNELCSVSLKTLTVKIEKIDDDYPDLTSSKKKKKPLKNSIEIGDHVITNNSFENVAEVSSSSSSRNIRNFLRSTNSEKTPVQNATMLEVDNTSVSSLETSIEMSNHCDEMNIKKGRINIVNQNNTPKIKKFNEPKNTGIYQNSITPTRKSNRLKSYCHGENIYDHAKPIIQNQNKIQTSDKKKDERIKMFDSETMNEGILIPNLFNQEPIKRKRGRPKKNVVLELYECESENNISMHRIIEPLNGNYGKEIENKIDEDDFNMENSEMNNYSQHQINQETIYNQSIPIIENQNEIQINEKKVDETSTNVDFETVNEEKIISNLFNEEPVILLEQYECHSQDDVFVDKNIEQLNGNCVKDEGIKNNIEEDLNMEISQISNYGQPKSSGETMHNKSKLIEIHDQIPINDKMKDEEETTDFEIVNGGKILPILFNPGPLKRKRGRPKKNIVLELNEFESEENVSVVENIKHFNGHCHKDEIIEHNIKAELNREFSPISNYSQPQNAEETIHNKAKPILEIQDEIQINGKKKKDETTKTYNSEIVNEGEILPILFNPGPLKRRRGRPKKTKVLKLKEGRSEVSVDENVQQLSLHRDEGEIIEHNIEEDINMEISQRSTYSQSKSSGETMHNKAKPIIQIQDEIKIKDKNKYKTTKTTDSETANEGEILPILFNPGSIKRKGGCKKNIVSEQNDCEAEDNVPMDVNIEQLNVSCNKDEIIEKNLGVNAEKLIFNNLRKLCENDEIVKIFEIERTQISDESKILPINGKKRKLCDELQILESFQDKESDVKSKENIDEHLQKDISHDEKFKNKLEIYNITPESELMCSKFEWFKENEVHYSINDKILNNEIFSGSQILNNGESNAEMNEIGDSKITVEYADFGYDIHRRTSFRKILERAMEASRSEMEMATSKANRNERCKSVPLEDFHSNIENDICMKSVSADSKLKYLKDKRNSNAYIKNIDNSNVKKSLDYNSHSPPKTSSLRRRAKSINMFNEKLSVASILKQTGESSHDQHCDRNLHNGIVSVVNVKTNCNKELKEEIAFKSRGVVTDTMKRQMKSMNDASFNVIPTKQRDDSRQVNAGHLEDIIDQEDLEVQKLLLGNISSKPSHGRFRSKSFSGDRCIEKFKRRSKSVVGRRIKKKNKIYGGLNDSTEAVRKVYEFNVGDCIWGKVGNYPYWPGLVTEDPETSEFKKFRLLRSTPYYHLRFFGDNGKRAWTSYCIPYVGPKDLDKLQGTENDYYIKATHLEKWKKAVEEAERLKNYTLEKKFEFFDILPSKERCHISEAAEDIPSEDIMIVKSIMEETDRIESKNDVVQSEKVPMKISSVIKCIEDVAKNVIESAKCNLSPPRKHNSPMKDQKYASSPRKRNIPMKESSVLACIDDVVNKYCSPKVQSPKYPSSTKRNSIEFATFGNVNKYCSSNVSSPEAHSKRNRKTKEVKKKMKDSDSDIDIGLELLSLPAIVSSPNMNFKSPEKTSFNKLPEQSTSTGTPLSSRVAYGTRSKYSSKLKKRILSDEFSHVHDSQVSSKEPKSDMVICSPRSLKLKRQTIEVGQTNTVSQMSDNSFLIDIGSRLPEYKKNLFRGVTKEKVCQICEKFGDVMKCRGPCNGDFHIECVENSFKETELSMKEQEELRLKEEFHNLQIDEKMEDNTQVQIKTIVSRKKISDTVILSPINRKIPMMEQFDRKMKELMSHVESRISIDSTDSSSEEIDSLDKIEVVRKPNGKNSKKRKGLAKHVSGDVNMINSSNTDITKHKPTTSENFEQTNNADDGVYKCTYCISTVTPVCFVCNLVVSKKGNTMRQRCSLQKCGRYYHLECLSPWHQTKWSFILHDKRKSEALDSFVCPRHSCHICASENLGLSMGRCPNDKLVKCLRCPATYHNSYHCVPAGTEILTSTQIVCPRHFKGNKKSDTLNTIWCFVCSKGGNLICCDTCPTSVHSDCLPVNLLDDDTYMCEDCESGRLPLYDEVVWVKCGSFRWWPAIILFPSEVPKNISSKRHNKGEFVVKFFGTYNYLWVGKGRVFLYQEGDTGDLNNTKNKIDEAFIRAIKEAANVYSSKKGLRAKKQKEVNNGLKPPPYVKIKVNRPVGNVKVFEGNLSNTTSCDCDPMDKNPCGPNSNCLNRILLTECNPEICPTGERCKNQSFEKREYPQVKPYRTTGRGWGLKTLEPIKKGQFVIEYVGEIIDDEEYLRRITRMHEQKDENYYFLTIDKDRMLDAGPKGNVARFMNHSCQPNCETQKWTVNGDTRVGLFAIENISVDAELTFNYNLECAGREKKICRCGALNCSGFIGVKPEDQRSLKKNSTMKPVEHETPTRINNDSCFICGKLGDVGKCSHKSCLRSYHLECVQFNSWPKGKWNCSSHNCNICSKRTARICVFCNNSYCSNHLEGNIRHDDSLGFLCCQHDQKRKKATQRKTIDGNPDSSSSNSPKRMSLHHRTSETLRSERYKKRLSCFESNISPKKLKLND